jgi:dipeptidyl-peptidase-4
MISVANRVADCSAPLIRSFFPRREDFEAVILSGARRSEESAFSGTAWDTSRCFGWLSMTVCLIAALSHAGIRGILKPLALSALLVVAPAILPGQGGRKRLTVESAAHPEVLVAPGIQHVAWRPGGDQISYIRRQGSGPTAVTTLWIYDVDGGKERELLRDTGGNLKLSLASYQWSPKGDALLLEGQNDLWLLDMESGQRRRLTDDPEEEEGATFSPAGDRIAFVKANNIYTEDLKTGLLKKLTADGSDDVLNGKLDWVYEEELANRATSRAYEWSPNGKQIAYLRLDDTPVPQYPLTDYLGTHVGLSRQRFPQAGDPNPTPSFHVLTVGEGKVKTWTYRPKTSDPVPTGSRDIEYFGPAFSWTPDSQAVSFLTLNRAQTELTVHLWDAARGEDRVLLTEQDPYWINSLDPPYFAHDGQGFLCLSERDGWLHLYRSAVALGQAPLQQVTRGNWMIDHPAFSHVPMFQVDEKGGWIYFAATERDPRERHLYRVHFDGSGFERLSKEPGVHSLNLAPSSRFLVDQRSDPETPPQTVLLKDDGKLVATLDKPENHLQEYALAKTEFVEVKAADGATLYARLAKPADFDPGKKYPVIINVYGGPHAQLVQKRWGVTGLEDQLFAQEGYLTWSLDNRGSGGRGHAWESVVFKDTGRHELEDQLAGVAYLKSLAYVDSRRIAIRGWSYGGYMTLYALTHAPEVFKCGAAGGPVTAWKFYDSIYTERYMRTPSENPEGYKTASPLESTDKLKGKVLLIHGADDDNVHLQNTMNFINALVKAQRPFELYIQPGQKHGFHGEAVETYLAQRYLDFFKGCLQ